MKKSIKMGVKPLAMATALAAGTTVSMMATALPGGDTLGALAGVVNESICQQSVDMTIASGARTVTAGTGTCQLRTLPPTHGFRLSASSPAGGSVVDSSAMVAAGGELYETYVGGERSGVTLLTPNRALATSRAITFSSDASEPSLAYDFSAAVQPATGLQPEWLTGSYRLVTRTHSFNTLANGLEHGLNMPGGAEHNPALAERNYTVTTDVTFNGNGTCSIDDIDSHLSGQIKKDPTYDLWGIFFAGEQDVDCQAGYYDTDSNPETPDEFVGCAQNDGDNYALSAAITVGTTFTGAQEDEIDWMDQQGGGSGSEDGGCTYVTSPGKVDVTYTMNAGVIGNTSQHKTWTVSYDVSADLRYLVSDGDSAVDRTTTNSNTGSNGGYIDNYGGMQIGVRTGGAFGGGTYLVNLLQATYASSTPATASYENPLAPVYQEEECVSRAAVTLGTAGSCSITGLISTCSGRANSGYEDSAYDAGDGTIIDSLEVFEGSPSPAPTCAWSGTSSDLTVTVDQLDPDGNPVTMTYTGAVSDNGEALVMHGIASVGMLPPDEDNAPILNGQKFNMIGFMVGQEYQGDLDGNSDADAESNLAEFTWSKDVTPAGGSVRSDLDGDSDADLFFRNSSGTNLMWRMQNAAVDAAIALGTNNSAYTVIKHGDIDGDGDKDLVLRNPSTGTSIGMLMQASGLQATVSLGTNNSGLLLKATGDADADGDDDLYLRNDSTGQIIVVLLQGGAVSTTINVGYNNTGFAFKGVGDADADGDDDVYLRNDSTGQQILVKIANGANGGVVHLSYNNTGFGFVALGDADADGDDDMYFRNDATGQQVLLPIQSGAALPLVNLGYNNTGFIFKALGDGDGDGDDDLYFRNDTSGQIVLLQVQGAASAGLVNIGYNATYLGFAGTGDYDADGDADIYLRSSTGSNVLVKVEAAANAGVVGLAANNSTYVPYVEDK